MSVWDCQRACALALLRAARIDAGMRGAEFVTPDDVKAVAPLVIPHRLVLAPEAVLEGIACADDHATAARSDTGAAVTRMSLRQNALALIVLTVLMAIIGDWSGDRDLARLWYFALAVLLLGLAYEGWVMQRTGLGVSFSSPEATVDSRSTRYVADDVHASAGARVDAGGCGRSTAGCRNRRHGAHARHTGRPGRKSVARCHGTTARQSELAPRCVRALPARSDLLVGRGR
jgi:hypothetical protein